MAKWMTVDPGISGTGWAVFRDAKLHKWGVIRSYEPTWTSKAKDIVKQLRALEWKYLRDAEQRYKTVYCEWPSNFTGSAKGLAALNSGSILKLSYLIGKISSLPVYLKLVSVQQWKGQLPKEVTKARAEKYFKRTGFKSHDADAVGIGQYVLEKGLV